VTKLEPDWLIQPELMSDRGDLVGTGGFTTQNLRWIARDHAHEGERQHAHDHEDRDERDHGVVRST
jgi:hypothetical protein